MKKIFIGILLFIVVCVNAVQLYASGFGGGGSTFAMQSDWVNPIGAPYYATGAGVIGTGNTTLAGTCTSGSTSCTLNSAAAFAINGGGVIGSGGVASADLRVQITGINGNVITFTPALSSTTTNKKVYTDDTVALQAAMNSGKNVYLPALTFFNTTTTITYGAHSQVIAGPNLCTSVFPANCATINNRTTNRFTINTGNHWYPTIQNLQFYQDFSFAPVSGNGGVYCNPSTSFGGFRFENLFFNGNTVARSPFTDIEMAGACANGSIRNINGIANTYGILMHTSLAQGASVIDGVAIQSCGNTGILINSADSNRWTNIEVAGCIYDIVINAGVGQRVLNQTFMNTLIENYSGGGIVIISNDACTTTSGVLGPAFDNFEANPNVNISEVVYIGPNVCSASIINGHIETQTGGTSGIHDLGVDSVMVGNSITSRIGNAVTNGILLDNSIDAMVSGNKISTNMTNGINCINTTTGFNISSNSARAATTPIASTCYGVANTTVMANN